MKKILTDYIADIKAFFELVVENDFDIGAIPYFLGLLFFIVGCHALWKTIRWAIDLRLQEVTVVGIDFSNKRKILPVVEYEGRSGAKAVATFAYCKSYDTGFKSNCWVSQADEKVAPLLSLYCFIFASLLVTAMGFVGMYQHYMNSPSLMSGLLDSIYTTIKIAILPLAIGLTATFLHKLVFKSRATAIESNLKTQNKSIFKLEEIAEDKDLQSILHATISSHKFAARLILGFSILCIIVCINSFYRGLTAFEIQVTVQKTEMRSLNTKVKEPFISSEWVDPATDKKIPIGAHYYRMEFPKPPLQEGDLVKVNLVSTVLDRGQTYAEATIQTPVTKTLWIFNEVSKLFFAILLMIAALGIAPKGTWLFSGSRSS